MTATPDSGRNQSLRPTAVRAGVEVVPYGAFVRRALRAYGRRVAEGAADELRGLVDLRDELDGLIADAVAGLRAEPHAHSWQRIADVLGITRQAAMQRWPDAQRRPSARRAACPTPLKRLRLDADD